MKKLFYLIAVIAILGLIVAGCIPVVPPAEQDEPGALSSKNPGVLNVPTITYPDIQTAIGAAVSGDTIQVADGVYTITSRIDVNTPSITITGNIASPENVVVQYSPAAGTDLVFDMRASNVTIEGIKTISGKSGFYFDQAAVTGCTISHCIVESTYERGIYIHSSSNHTIEYTTITNPGQMVNIGYNIGVFVQNATGTTISNCTITSDKVNHMKWGIDLESGADTTVITGNTITGSWQAAIRVASGVKPVIITNNDIDDATEGYSYEGAISLDGYNDGSVISGNHIDNVVSSSAIVIWNSWNIEISNNQIGINGPIELEGIRVSGCSGSGDNRVEVTGNTINNTGYAGIILVGNSSNAYLNNNTITNCKVGISVHNESSNVTAVHNNIVGNTEWGLFNATDKVVDATCNWWGSKRGPSRAMGEAVGHDDNKGDRVSPNVKFAPWLKEEF